MISGNLLLLIFWYFMNLLHRPFVLVFLVITGTADLVLFSTIYIYSNRTCTGLRFLFVQYARQVWTKILISFRSSTVPSSSTHTTLCSERKMDKKNEKELLANPNPSLEAVATFCLFCNASLSPACPLNQVTLREFKCTTRDLQLLLITFWNIVYMSEQGRVSRRASCGLFAARLGSW